MSPWRRHRLDLGLAAFLALFTIVRGLLWIGVYPILKIADEPAHFDDIQYRAEHRFHAPRADGTPIDKVLTRTASLELRTAWTATNGLFRNSFVVGRFATPQERVLEEQARDRKNRETSGQSTALNYPGVYYTAGALAYRLFDRASVLTRLFAVRTASLLWALALVLGTFVAARCVFPSRLLAVTAALLAALQPLAAQQTVAINSDAGVIGLCAMVFALQLFIVRRMPAPPLAPILGMAIGLALAIETKPQAYGLAPGCIGLALWLVVHQPRSRRSWLLVGAALIAFALTRAACISLLDRPLPGGAAGALASGPAAMRALPIPSLLGFVPWLWNRDDAFWSYLFRTGWGSFCWLDVTLAEPWFVALKLAADLLWLGLGAAIARLLLRPDDSFFFEKKPFVFSFLTAGTGFLFILFLEYFANTTMNLEHAIQGRAFLFVLPAAAVTATVGFSSLVPARLRPLCATLVVTGAMLLAAGSLFTVVRHQYVG